MKLLSCIACVFFFLPAFSQRSIEARSGLKRFTLHDKTYGQIDYCMSTRAADSLKPVLLFLDGSGASPLLRLIADKSGQTMIQQSFAIDVPTWSEKYHIVMISKPGIPFSDSIYTDDVNNYHYGDGAPPAAYTQNLSLGWRAETASLVLDHVLKTKKADRREVIVFGYSEGAQVAPKVAVLNNSITHCIAFVGSGINQLYSFIIDTRMRAERKEISHEEAQHEIDSLFAQFDSIYRDPRNTQKEWIGHSYLRWSSFCTEQPMDNLLKLDIPIYIAQGSKDRNGQILSYDYVQLEFLRRGKRNLTYKVYPNADHYFNEEVTVNGKTETISRMDEAIAEALRSVKK